MVSDLTKQCKSIEAWYITIIGTRYLKLDNLQNEIIQFDNYNGSNALEEAFSPSFETSPSAIHAITDIGEVVDWIKGKFLVATKSNLAVLHNCNKIVNAFSTTKWVLDSGGTIISRSVTSCAGITAYLVLLTQTRVGFLSSRREKSFRQLPAQEQTAQKEEVYARATVTLIRAERICFIMGPLDMCGLVGAATIIGYEKYGTCFSGQNEQENPVFLIRLKDEKLVEAPDDSAFLQSLRHSCARVNGVYPPISLIEVFFTEDDSAPPVQRLHLIVVDLQRRRMADRVWRVLSNLQIDQHAAETLHMLPIPWKQDQDAYQLRYVFSYAMDRRPSMLHFMACTIT